jgi:two-component system sensor histidine kinase KdpD
MTAAPFPPTEPYLLAVVGRHPDTQPFLRDVQWIAAEKSLSFALAIHKRGPIRSWLVGEDIGPNSIGERVDAPSSTWQSWREVAALLKGPEAHRPAAIIFGPGRQSRWLPGMTPRARAAIARVAAAKGIPILEAFQPDRGTQRKSFLGVHWRHERSRPWYQVVLLTMLAVALVGLLVSALAPYLPASSLVLLFLAAVIYTGATYGFTAAILATFLGLALNSLLLKENGPIHALDAVDILRILVFLLVGGITSNLSGNLRGAAGAARRQAREARALFQLMREIAVAAEPADTFRAIAHQCDEAFSCRTVMLAPYKSGETPSNTSARNRATSLQVVDPPDAQLSEDELDAARWSFANNLPAGRGTDTLPDLEAHIVPLETEDGVVAVLVLQDIPEGVSTSPGFRRIVASMSRLSAIAVERSLRKQEIENARVLSQTEGLRSALLSSISHDFGTPLASIIGSATSLVSYGGTYSSEVTKELLTTIVEEAERLNRFVKNLLQMTRLESGVLVPRLTWADAEDLISTSIDAVQRRLTNHDLFVDVDERLPLLNVDFVLMESVLVNLIDNAVKYAPPKTPIQVCARAFGDEVLIEVTDHGRGIAAEDLGAVFDKFYRAKHRDRTVPGTGLGLAICKGIIEAHGGGIEALSPGLGQGTTIRIHLPIRKPDSAALAEA